MRQRVSGKPTALYPSSVRVGTISENGAFSHAVRDADSCCHLATHIECCDGRRWAMVLHGCDEFVLKSPRQNPQGLREDRNRPGGI